MTRVSCDAQAMTVTLCGHAGAGSYGNDIVCAALSILAMTLEKRVTDCAAELLPTVRHSMDGMAVSCRPAADSEERCREIFATVGAGFELLAEHYPQYVLLYHSDASEHEEKRGSSNEQ